MKILSNNTEFIFLLTTKTKQQDDVRHIIDIILGIKYICNQFLNEGLNFSIYLDNEYHNNFNSLCLYFDVNCNFNLFSSENFFNNIKILDRENLLIFIVGHGTKEQLFAGPEFVPSNFYSQLQSNKFINNVFIFFGQCYAGQYKNVLKTNNAMNLYIFGSSDEYYSHSTSSLLSKGITIEDKTYFNKLLKLLKLNDNCSFLLASNLFLFECFRNLQMIVNKDIDEDEIKLFFNKVYENHIIDKLECDIHDDNKIIELDKIGDVNEIERINKILDDAYGDRNAYKLFLEYGKYPHPISRYKLPDGTIKEIDMYELFKRMIEAVPKITGSQNLSWYRKY